MTRTVDTKISMPTATLRRARLAVSVLFVLAGAVMIYGAIRLRRWRDDN